jgi:hypothetical protein
MLVHSATAPRAARLALAALPRDQWLPTYDTAWSIAAALTAVYAPDRPAPEAAPSPAAPEEVADRAAAHGDEHVLTFTEVALESHRRGNPRALPAARVAQQLIG